MSTLSQLAELENEIRPSDSLTADRLAHLRAALEPEGDPGGWIGVSPFDVVDVEAVADRVTGGGDGDHRAAAEERLRNVLILFPILVTWLSLAYAAFGYQYAIQVDPALVDQPFLLLWEQGFRGLVPAPWSFMSFLTLWVVALFDMFVIAAVIILTFRIQTHVSVVEARKDSDMRALAGRLHDALGGAALELAGRATAPALIESLNTAAQSLARELKAERVRLAGLGDQNERYVAELRTIATDLRKGADGFVDAVRGLAPVLDRLDSAGAAISSSVLGITSTQERLASALADQTEELRHEHLKLGDISSDMRSLAETAIALSESTWPAASARLVTAEREFQDGVERLRQTIEADRAERRDIERSTSTVLGEITRLAAGTTSLIASQNDTLQRLAAVATSLERVGNDVNAMVRRHGEFSDRFERSMNAVASAIETQSRGATGTR